MNTLLPSRQFMPIIGHVNVLRSMFTQSDLQQLREELTADPSAMHQAFKKGSIHAAPIDEVVSSLHDRQFLQTASVVGKLGMYARGAGLSHVAHYDTEGLPYTRPNRNRLQAPSLRMTVGVAGTTTYRTGGIAVLGTHYFGGTYTLGTGDVIAANDMSPAVADRPLLSVIDASKAACRWTLDFVPGPTSLQA